MKAVCFVNGFRERIVQESGGLEGLDSLFDIFVDPSSFMKPWELQLYSEDALSHEKLVEVNSEKEFETLIRKYGITYFLFIGLEYSKKNFDVLKLIASHDAEYGLLNIRQDFYNFFYPFRSSSFSDKLKKIIKYYKSSLSALLKNMDVPAPVHLFTNDPRVIIYPKMNNNTLVKRINYRDYYLSANYKKKPMNDKYAVFADQAYTNYRTYENGLVKANKFYTKEKMDLYYELINSYLKKMSEMLDLKIVVCLHPNSPNHLKHRYLDEFIVTKYETGRYAKFADVIATHDSNAVSYGFIYNIKTVMVVLDGAIPLNNIHDIKLKARSLGITIHNWPSNDISFDKMNPPNNLEITEFFIPNKNSGSLIEEIKDVIKNM